MGRFYELKERFYEAWDEETKQEALEEINQLLSRIDRFDTTNRREIISFLKENGFDHDRIAYASDAESGEDFSDLYHLYDFYAGGADNW